MECQYCKKQFSSKSSLNFHTKSAKYCLKIQNSTVVAYTCVYCATNFTTKHRLNSHVKICSIRTSEEEDKQHQQIESLKEENSNMKLINDRLIECL